MSGLAPGRFRPVVFFRNAYAGEPRLASSSASSVLVSQAEGEIVLDLDIMRAGTLSVRLERGAGDAAREAEGRASIEVHDVNERLAAFWSGLSPGQSRLASLAPGRYTVRLTSPGAQPQARTAEVHDGERATVTFDLP